MELEKLLFLALHVTTGLLPIVVLTTTNVLRLFPPCAKPSEPSGIEDSSSLESTYPDPSKWNCVSSFLFGVEIYRLLVGFDSTVRIRQKDRKFRANH
uniref:Uncharacterized protein n=1 Tax=Vespula pensylvanica TaxID=30213 RepID=A0A834KN96_VESPE|nr:hypothetical protein H0235_013733 [Vespula pensylvanica]